MWAAPTVEDDLGHHSNGPIELLRRDAFIVPVHTGEDVGEFVAWAERASGWRRARRRRLPPVMTAPAARLADTGCRSGMAGVPLADEVATAGRSILEAARSIGDGQVLG